MTAFYTHELAAGAQYPSGISGATVVPAAHYAGSGCNNATNKDEFLDLDITVSLKNAANNPPTAGEAIKTYVLYAMNGTNYEDGLHATDGTNGTTPSNPAPNANALVDSHGVQAITGPQKWTVREIPLLPYPYTVEIYNGCTGATGSAMTVLQYGRKFETHDN